MYRQFSENRSVGGYLFVFAILVLEALSPVYAQSDEPIVIPKTASSIELDGYVRAQEWADARVLPLTQHQPDFGADPSERTEILITYTDDYVYAACRCYDRGSPSAPSVKRDFLSADTDYFVLLLDTFNDDETGLFFATTPTGLRLDLSIFNDATGNISNPQDWPFDTSWNSFWNVEVRQTDEGWFAEMRIPVSSLRFQVSGGEVTMGLTSWRYIARKSEEAVFPAIPPNWGFFSTWKPSQARTAVFKDLDPHPPLRVTPYALGGLGQQYTLNDGATAYERQTDPTYDAGLDVKYGLTGNLTMDLTVNTDFAQVEADNQQVNLTRFPLFFPEKRRFFQERSSNFAFNFGGSNRLFYSRRIGLHRGQQVRILGGARVVGREGPWDIGALNMQTARQSQLRSSGEPLPSENLSVLRFRRRVLNPYSNVGGIWTSRIGLDGSYNVAYGADGLFRIIGDQYLAVKWAQTFYDGLPAARSVLAPSRMLMQWERRSYEGLSYDLRFDRAGEQYRPGLGFELRENYFRLGDRFGYGWIPGRDSPLQRHRLNLEGEAYFRNPDRSLQSLELGPEWEMTTNSGHSLTLEASHRVEDLAEPFALAETVVLPAGRYDFQMGEISYSAPGGRTFTTDLEVTGGSFYDGRRVTVGIRPTWNASRYLRLRGFYQLNRLDFPPRSQSLTAHIGRLRIEVTPNVEYSALAFIQYNSLQDVTVGNVRLRYNPRQGTDLYLVYNERLNTDRHTPPAQPRLPASQNRAVLLKYTYTFNW